jgi:hypothetical protein
VPQRFKVPGTDISWDGDLWGVKLGAIANSIRKYGEYVEYRGELEEMGFW